MTVPPPYAKTEKGQLCRLAELDADPDWGPGVFALKLFGGGGRVSRLRCALQQLTSRGVECAIVSKGMVGTIKKCLNQVGLLPFFSRIIGKIGSSYGMTEYDRQLPPHVSGFESWLGKPEADFEAKRSKIEHVQHLINERSLQFGQAVFLEDEVAEISLVQSICKTIYIIDGQGIQERELQELLSEFDAR